MEVEALDNNGLMSRFSMNPKYTSNNDLNEINSMLSVSRMSQNNDRQIIIDTNPLRNQNETQSSAQQTYMKFQSNFNIINDMFNNMKTDTNNNENESSDKNVKDVSLPRIESPKKETIPIEVEKPKERERVNDVFINLHLKDPLDLSGSFNSNASFFLHEPKQQKQRRIESGASFSMLSKLPQDNSFDEGFFDSLNIGRRGKAPSVNNVVKKWDEGAEDDELASILG